MNYEIDYRSILSAIHVPTLVLHREGDLWCSVEHAHYFAENIPSAELRILPGDDHLPWYGAQDGLITEIKAFVVGEFVAPCPSNRGVSGHRWTCHVFVPPQVLV